MIYVDSSVLLAHVFSEARRPPSALWLQRMYSSRLLAYEVTNRVLARDLGDECLALAQRLIDQVTLIELAPDVLKRALAPFPVATRTLDSLHLATLDYLCSNGQALKLASFDKRLNDVAAAMGYAVATL